mgnify:CR=1 FL=1
MAHKEHAASEVFDNGRRGEPRQGCDCVQCFGYCMIDRDAERRELLRFQADIGAPMGEGA